MNIKETQFNDLQLLDELVFKTLKIILKNIHPESESREYFAHRFQLDHYQILFRVAKITPTKIGQFVSIWKRNEQEITAPFDVKDDLDFLMIATKTPIHFGVFIFPKKIMHEYQILSDETRDGKRGIRIYPTWDEPTSKQAKKTQLWQTQYFLNLSDINRIDLDLVKKILTLK